MTGTLRVTPEQLISTAGSFSDTAGTVQNLTNTMVQTANSMNNVWTGDAATAFYRKISDLQDDNIRMVRMIQEHSTDLNAMAKQYISAEQAAQATASALNADIIK